MARLTAFVASLPLRSTHVHLLFAPVVTSRRNRPKVVPACRRTSRAKCCAEHDKVQSTNPSSAAPSQLVQQVKNASSTFVNLFPLWSVVASALGLYVPSAFSAFTTPSVMQGFLSLLMLSTGLTLSPQDLIESFRKPLPVIFNFVVCFAVLPVIALGISAAFGLEGKIRASLIFLAMISGGQASNLCTLIAGGDTALSVTMTTSTTLLATLMVPTLSTFFLGTVVAVDRVQMALTTARVTLLPIIIGAASNQLFPEKVAMIRPLLPVLGIIAVMIVVIGPVTQTASVFSSACTTLLIPVLLLHTIGGAIGFAGPSIVRAGWKMSITTAFETAFKSPALSYVLAKRLFPPGVELASAVSIVALVPIAALFAVILKQVSGRRTSANDDESL